MQITLPLVLIALGSVALVALRDGRLLVAALLVQWGGLALLLLDLMPDTRIAWLELTVALVCSALLSWTIWALHNANLESMLGLDESHRANWLYRQERRSRYARQEGLADQVLLWVTALAGGVAGFGLARLYSLGGSDDAMLAFYWILLSAALSLVVHGARDLVKLGIGLVVLLNAMALLIETMALGSLSDAALGLLSACRLALVLLISYMLVVFKVTFLDADLDDIFDARAGIIADEMAIVAVRAGEGDYIYSDADQMETAEAEEEAGEESSVEIGSRQEEMEEGHEAPAGG